jgi:hypothetical protein
MGAVKRNALYVLDSDASTRNAGYKQSAQHAEPPVEPPKAQAGCAGFVQSASVLHVVVPHVVVSMQTGDIPGAPHPAPPPDLWHSPWPHEPHASQAPVMHGGPVVVVDDVVVTVVVGTAGSGAHSSFTLPSCNARAPN